MWTCNHGGTYIPTVIYSWGLAILLRRPGFVEDFIFSEYFFVNCTTGMVGIFQLKITFEGM